MRFQRDKYSFSAAPGLIEVGYKYEKKRREQIGLLEKEAFLYGVILKEMFLDKPKDSERNLILNLAKYLMKDFEQFNYMQEKKRIHLKTLANRSKTQREFLVRWYDYLVVYTLILSNPNYKLIEDYLRIQESERAVKSYGSDKERKNAKGIVFKRGKKSVGVLTSRGEFIRLEKGRCEIGAEYSGNIKRTILDYKKQIGIVSILLVSFVGIFFMAYNKVETMVIINTTSQIKFEVNGFNKVVSSYSASEKGKELVSTSNLEKKSLDGALYEVLKYANDNKMVPNDRILITITGSDIQFGELQKTGEYIYDNKIKIDINNNGNEHKLYEIIHKQKKESKDEG